MIPDEVIRRAFQKNDVHDSIAFDRRLCLFCKNPAVRPHHLVLVFAPSKEGKVSSATRVASSLTSVSIGPKQAAKSSSCSKDLAASDLFQSLLRLLSCVVKEELVQVETEEIRWLQNMPQDMNIAGIPPTIMKAVGDMLCVDTDLNHDLSHFHGLFSRVCCCPPLSQLKKSFKFTMQGQGSHDSDTVISVKDPLAWQNIGCIHFQRLPILLAVDAKCACNHAIDSLQLTFGNGTGNPVKVTYTLLAFTGIDERKTIASYMLHKPTGCFTEFIGGLPAEERRKQRKRLNAMLLQRNPSFLIFRKGSDELPGKSSSQRCKQQNDALQTGLAASTLVMPDPNQEQRNPDAATLVTRGAVKIVQHQVTMSRPTHAPQFDAQNRKFPSTGSTTETLCQKITSLIEVTKQTLEKLIEISNPSQGYCAGINRFDNLKDKDLEFYLRHLRLTLMETPKQKMISAPMPSLQKTIVHSFSHFQFPEFKGCIHGSEYIFVDKLHMDVRSKFGCSHIMTLANLSMTEIFHSYGTPRVPRREKYEDYLLHRGKGIMVSFSLYNMNCKEADSQPEFKALQLQENPGVFKPKEFGYTGNLEQFEAESYALLIMGMLSEMADKGCKVKDCDVPQDFVIRLPVSATPELRDTIIHNILNRSSLVLIFPMVKF